MNQNSLTENNGLEEARARRVSGPRNPTLDLGTQEMPQQGRALPSDKNKGIQSYKSVEHSVVSFLEDQVNQENGKDLC